MPLHTVALGAVLTPTVLQTAISHVSDGNEYVQFHLLRMLDSVFKS